MPNILLDTRNVPSDINIEELVSGMQTLPVKVVKINEQLSENFLDGIDVFVSLNPKISPQDLQLISKRGIVPLLHKNFASVGFTTFQPIEEKGNSFLFEDWNNWQVFAALVRCLENYNFPYDWSNIVHSVKNLEIEI